MLAQLDGEPLEPAYRGYTACPLVTGYGKLVLAEFDNECRVRASMRRPELPRKPRAAARSA